MHEAKLHKNKAGISTQPWKEDRLEVWGQVSEFRTIKALFPRFLRNPRAFLGRTGLLSVCSTDNHSHNSTYFVQHIPGMITPTSDLQRDIVDCPIQVTEYGNLLTTNFQLSHLSFGVNTF